jgi:ABC-type nitrate/sulfonate/bicarbonate transport system permease component
MRLAAGGTASRRATSVALATLGIVAFLILWEIIGRFRLVGLSWPPLTDVLAFLIEPARWGLFGRALRASLEALIIGYILGLLTGLSVGIAAHLFLRLKAGLDRLSAFVNAIPSIAIAPIFIIFVGMQTTPAALAALTTFFVIYVSMSSGLAATTREWSDLMAVLGASRLTRLWRVELPAALPTITSGMRLAAPAALIGVLIGEWFGSPRGIGVLIINAMQNFQITLLWSAVLLTMAISLTLFGLLGLVQTFTARRFR